MRTAAYSLQQRRSNAKDRAAHNLWQLMISDLGSAARTSKRAKNWLGKEWDVAAARHGRQRGRRAFIAPHAAPLPKLVPLPRQDRGGKGCQELPGCVYLESLL